MEFCHAFAKKKEERLRGLSFVTFGIGRGSSGTRR